MQEKRPAVLEKPREGRNSGFSSGSLMLYIFNRGWDGIIKRDVPSDGLSFAFSEGPFNITYRHKREARTHTLHGINAVVIPGNYIYHIGSEGIVYFSTLASWAARQSGLTAPVGFTMRNIKKHLRDGNANKLVIPEIRKNEAMAKGGDLVHEQHEKRVVVGPENQEFSAGNSFSPQDYHVHFGLVELYTTFSGMELYYAREGRTQLVKIDPGDTVIVPRGVAHYAVMYNEEPTFVIMASGGPIAKDKFVLPDNLDPKPPELRRELESDLRI